MTVLLLTIGSAGDVHPFIGLGLALQKRGHRVKIITNPFFGGLVEKVGLEMVPLGTIQEFDLARNDPDLWHRTKGLHTIATAVSRGLRSTYDAVLKHYVPGETVIAASSLALGARIAQDKHDLPMATVHLSPAVIRSAVHPPKLPGLFMPDWLPVLCRRWLYGLGDRFMIDPLLSSAVNGLRAELGLPPVRGILKDWWNSPKLVIGLFPQWFASPASDWPAQTRLTGFPLYDERGVADLPPKLLEFLDAGEPPIIFTPGSANWHAHDFFRESVSACIQLHRRGILLSNHAGHIPSQLPATVRCFGYAPFSQLLPRCAVLVHHGGIGTSSQAMKAGLKQLVVPFSHDQPDNAQRMQRLGVAREIHPKNYRSRDVAKVLGELLADASVSAKTAEVARRFVDVDPLGQACEFIETLQPSM